MKTPPTCPECGGFLYHYEQSWYVCDCELPRFWLFLYLNPNAVSWALSDMETN
jgi:hypothetical protein